MVVPGVGVRGADCGVRGQQKTNKPKIKDYLLTLIKYKKIIMIIIIIVIIIIINFISISLFPITSFTLTKKL